MIYAIVEKNVACITTPYLDYHNDYLQIYLIAEEQGYILTDDGWILDDIKSLKADDESLKLIERILKRFGIERNEDEISVKTDLANFTKAKEQFMRTVNEMMNCFSERKAHH
ncbi:DUF1828 domain-containing protein [Rickettsia hoogstraalii]|uniref:DUF1828 domain-containing protein n=1 Tax=Rickettsia hoogstraalii TaxID=467174 RepID=UPI0022548D33|nr:DUF1828 domain-containing protein [Rickettsia hoogstraalii]MCX4084214.1 DUF1828 domain-containing protein [Rickettsia hoogstraalii]